MTKKKIAIIGSGPSAFAVHNVLKKFTEFNTEVFTSGGDISEEIHTLKEYKNLSNFEKYEYFINNLSKKKSKTILPTKEFFLDENSYSKKNIFEIRKSKNLIFNLSNNLGGLSNVWGANNAFVSLLDFKNFKSYENQVNYYKKIIKITNLSGEKDINDICDLEYNKTFVNYGVQANKIVDNFKKKIKGKNCDIRVGFSKLALSSNGSNSCENCGLCMYGCHKDSIFSSRFYFKKEKNINFFSDVLDLSEEDNGVILDIKNTKTNKIYQKKFDKLFICAGAINTSILGLKLFRKKKISVNSLKIRDSAKYHYIAFSFQKETIDFKKTISLANIYIQCDLNNHTIHSQLYRSKIFFDLIFKKYNFFRKNKILNKIVDCISQYLIVGNIYLPQELSNQIEISNVENVFFLKGKNMNNFKRFFLLAKYYIKLLKYSFKLNLFVLPFFLSSKIGESQHFGASLPMSKNKELGKTDEDGLLIGFKNIYIADASCLHRIPSTPTTFLSMANSLRITEKFVQMFKK